MRPSLPLLRRTVIVALLGSPVAACWASSTASSASIDASSAVVGSLSTSVQASSGSSGGGDRQVVQGEYRVVEVGAAQPQPQGQRVRVTLARQGPGGDEDEGPVWLWLPAHAAAAATLQPGETITVRERVYGLEFARGQPRQAFFLALREAELRELRTQAVAL